MKKGQGTFSSPHTFCTPPYHGPTPFCAQIHFLAIWALWLELKFIIHLLHTLKALTSLNKESRPFFLGDNSIWRFLSGNLPSAITAFGGLERYFSLAIIGFGAFGFVVPKNYDRLGRMDKGSLEFLIYGGYSLQSSYPHCGDHFERGLYSGSRFDPRPKRLTIFHLILGEVNPY